MEEKEEGAEKEVKEAERNPTGELLGGVWRSSRFRVCLVIRFEHTTASRLVMSIQLRIKRGFI
jgi:hypothetical protein